MQISLTPILLAIELGFVFILVQRCGRIAAHCPVWRCARWSATDCRQYAMALVRLLSRSSNRGTWHGLQDGDWRVPAFVRIWRGYSRSPVRNLGLLDRKESGAGRDQRKRLPDLESGRGVGHRAVSAHIAAAGSARPYPGVHKFAGCAGCLDLSHVDRADDRRSAVCVDQSLGGLAPLGASDAVDSRELHALPPRVGSNSSGWRISARI